MSAAAYLHHVTLATGHSRRSPRSDVSPEVVDVVASWLDRALLPDAPSTQAPVPLPVADLAQFSAHVFTTAGGLVVTIYGPDILTLPPRTPTPIPLVTFGVARRSRGAAKLWGDLISAAQAAHSMPPMPGAPWLAVVLHPSLIAFPDASHWLGDFERCVAWAWIDRVAD